MKKIHALLLPIFLVNAQDAWGAERESYSFKIGLGAGVGAIVEKGEMTDAVKDYLTSRAEGSSGCKRALGYLTWLEKREGDFIKLNNNLYDLASAQASCDRQAECNIWKKVETTGQSMAKEDSLRQNPFSRCVISNVRGSTVRDLAIRRFMQRLKACLRFKQEYLSILLAGQSLIDGDIDEEGLSVQLDALGFEDDFEE